MPETIETRHLSLVILTVLITLSWAGIRALRRRTHVVMVVSGTSVLLVILTVLALAYLAAFGAA
ncbi:hypothetical protein GCM10022224_059700 [Nonomuraea antimicrobica]|uniref:PEP-CTERM protein-sorting domain-containing protein n=2 Tax=Nonomuraea antimicrobica TaxID=561173 RepID=A0ABP7CC05_9ACTN